MNQAQQQSIIIVAGGKGERAGGELPKQFQLLGNKPVLMHTIHAFYRYNASINIIIVLPEMFIEYWKELCSEHSFNIDHRLVIGGETRFHSVQNGLALVNDNEIVGVHDGARPFVSTNVIAQCYQTAISKQCGVIPVVDEPNSVRMLTENGSQPINRTSIKIVQTPQVFPAHLLKKAYEATFDPLFTDDASVAEQIGIKIEMIPGEPENIKITTQLDFLLGEQLLKSIAKS